MQNRDFRVSEGPFLGQKTKTSVSRRYSESSPFYNLELGIQSTCKFANLHVAQSENMPGKPVP